MEPQSIRTNSIDIIEICQQIIFNLYYVAYKQLASCCQWSTKTYSASFAPFGARECTLPHRSCDRLRPRFTHAGPCLVRRRQWHRSLPRGGGSELRLGRYDGGHRRIAGCGGEGVAGSGFDGADEFRVQVSHGADHHQSGAGGCAQGRAQFRSAHRHRHGSWR